MRVYVEKDMTVCHGYHVVSLKAGQVVEGPLAAYLAESGCEVTIEHDDRPEALPEPTGAGDEGDTGHDGAPPVDGGQDPVELALSAQVSQDSNAVVGEQDEPESELADHEGA